MPKVVRLVTSPFLAMTKAAELHPFLMIPSGTLVETRDETAEPGFRAMTWRGKELLVFHRDIAEQTVAQDDVRNNNEPGAAALGQTCSFRCPQSPFKVSDEHGKHR